MGSSGIFRWGVESEEGDVDVHRKEMWLDKGGPEPVLEPTPWSTELVSNGKTLGLRGKEPDTALR